MELQTLKTVEVSTFNAEQSCLQVLVPVQDGCFQTDKVVQAVADSIGLKECSRPHFRLFEGLLTPARCFSPNHGIPEAVRSLSLQKWCLDTKEEQKFTSQDDVALQLVFQQAKTWVQHDMIKLCDADIAQLEDYLDPAFTLYNQYLKLCQKSDGYHSYHFSQCAIVFRNADLHQSVVCKDDPCTVVLNLKSIDIVSGGKTRVYKWPCVKHWQLHPGRQEVSVEVCPPETSPAIIVIITKQCQFLVDVVAALVTQIQKSTPGSPSFHVSMIKTLGDGSTRWENALYIKP